MSRLSFVRHAPIDLGGRSLAIGHSLLPLKNGYEKFHANLAQGSRFGRILSSPLNRCLSLAEYLAKAWGADLEIREELTEINLGLWEGRAFSEIARTWPEIYEARGRKPWSTRPPQGESFEDLGERAFAFWQRIIEDIPEDGLLLVGHSGWIRSLYVKMDLLEKEHLFRCKVTYAEIVDLPTSWAELESWQKNGVRPCRD